MQKHVLNVVRDSLKQNGGYGDRFFSSLLFLYGVLSLALKTRQNWVKWTPSDVCKTKGMASGEGQVAFR